MAVTTCDACGNKVNDQAAVCPHCGKRRIAVSLAGAKPSKEELVALLAMQNSARPPSEGLFQTLLLPHPATTGTARLVELVCTALSFPLILAGVSTFMFGKKSSEASRGELAPVVRMTLFGTLGMVSVLGFAGVATGTMLAITGISLVALWTRGVIRASANKGPDL